MTAAGPAARRVWRDLIAPADAGGVLRVGLAPMAGYTDRVMRSLSQRHGACLTMTEVVNAAGIVHGSKRTLHLLEVLPSEGPVGAHLYGREPTVMAEAARRVEALERFDFIDINAGCPVRKIVAKGCGAALMGDVPRLADMVAAVREAVALPVTVKTRLGLTPEAFVLPELARAVEDAGAAVLWVHGRYARARHAGAADWDAIGRVKAERRLPVWGNGGVLTAEEARQRIAASGVDGALVGRAAIGNPWFFRGVAAAARGEPVGAVTTQARLAVIEEHLRGLVALKTLEQRIRRRGRLDPEEAACMLFRPHLLKYVQGYPGWKAVRRRLNTMRSVDEVMDAVRGVLTGGGPPGCADGPAVL